MDITFAGHHWPRFKSFVAGAFEAPDHVGAGTVPARVADGAFVRVCRGYEKGRERIRLLEGKASSRD